MRHATRTKKADAGHKIEVSCFYDTIESGIAYDENFQILADDAYSPLVYFKDNGQNVMPDDLFEISDYDKYASNFSNESTNYLDIVNKWWPKTIVPIISRSCSLNEISVSCLEQGEQFQNWNEFKNWIENQDEYAGETYDWLWDRLPPKAKEEAFNEAKKEIRMMTFDEILSNTDFWRGSPEDVGISLKPGYEIYNSKEPGHGRLCTVICRLGSDKESIDRLMWKAPVYCCVTMDGKEYLVSDEMNDRYEYSKDEALAIFKNMAGNALDPEALASVVEKMPDEPRTI